MAITPVFVVLVGFVGTLAFLSGAYVLQRGFERLGRRRIDIG